MENVWTREGGGGGISRVLKEGNVFEKAGCSLSVVYGSMPQEALASATSRGSDRAKGYEPGERVPFFACGLSSVMHPRNPHAPTMHFNYRYFETDGGVWWFGGGSDITPSYLVEDDIKHFHGTYKEVCDKHDAEFYPKFKKWADEYFLIKHRGETRGLGGIFFDDLNDREPDEIFAFSKDCLDALVPAYVPLVEKHKDDECVKPSYPLPLFHSVKLLMMPTVLRACLVLILRMFLLGPLRTTSLSPRERICHV